MTGLVVLVLAIVVAMAQACAHTVWDIYIGGSSVGHQWMVAVPVSGNPISSGFCVKADLYKEDVAMWGMVGTTTHKVRTKPAGDCVTNSLKRQGRVCCAESAFESAKEHAIVYKQGTKEKVPYNAATNNCQHFATRMSETLLKSYAHTRRMLLEMNGGRFSRAGAAMKGGMARASAAVKGGLAKAGAAVKKGANVVVAAIKRLFDIGEAAKKNGWSPVMSKGGRSAAAGKGRRSG